MFCKNCGKEINEQAVFCAHCGVPTDQTKSAQPVNQPKNRIIGFILCFFVPIAGLIVSIIENNLAKEEGSNNSFALAGIIISAISIALSIITAILCVIFFASFMVAISNGYFYAFSPMLFLA